jgi:cytochrome c oxidase assembly factor CtaG
MSLRRRYASAVSLLVVVVAAPALAHEGRVLEPHDLWWSWELEPELLLPFLLSAGIYVAGSRRLAATWHKGAFWMGWGTLALALLSPIHALGESLFSAHMAQHEILMLASAPLLVSSKPVAALLLGLPHRVRAPLLQCSRSPLWTGVWSRLSAPTPAWILHAAALWGWHAPALFQATLSSDGIHALQHTSFLTTALLFWWSLLHRSPGRSGHGAAVLYLFTTALHSGVLGAFLTFSPAVLYPAYVPRTGAFGLTALEDQQLGGLIMWIPAGILYTLFGVAFLAYWLRGFEPDPVSPGRISLK